MDRLIEADMSYGSRILACHVFFPVSPFTKDGKQSHACSTDIFCYHHRSSSSAVTLDEDVQTKR